MKQIILKPEFLIPIVGILVTYFTYLLLLTKNKDISSYLHLLFAFLIISVIPGTRLILIDRLHPKWLIYPSMTAISLLIIYLLIGLLAYKNSRYFVKDIIVLIRQDPALGALLVVVLASFMWSSIPETTFRYSYGLLFTSALAAHLGRRYSLKELFFLLRLSSLSITTISIIYVFFIPSIGIHTTKAGWKGALIHPNIFGAYLAFVASIWFLQVITEPKGRLFSISIFSLLTFALVNTRSVGGLVNFIFLIFIITFIKYLNKVNPRIGIPIFMFIMALGLLISLWGYTNFTDILALFGRDPTFTGRTIFWQQLIEIISTKPLLGHGHGGFWLDTNGPVSSVGSYGFQPVEGHNGFIDMALDTGLVGLILFIFSFSLNFYRALKTAWMKNYSGESLLPIIFLCFLLISNMAESRLLKVDYVWLYYIMLSIGIQNSDINNRLLLRLKKVSIF